MRARSARHVGLGRKRVKEKGLKDRLFPIVSRPFRPFSIIASYPALHVSRYALAFDLGYRKTQPFGPISEMCKSTVRGNCKRSKQPSKKLAKTTQEVARVNFMRGWMGLLQLPRQSQGHPLLKILCYAILCPLKKEIFYVMVN
jgi:hypothetical protein